jgi:hypothetical protein
MNHLCHVVPLYLIYHLNLVCAESLKVSKPYRCGQVDPGPLLAAVQIGDDQIGFRSKRVRVCEEGATAIGHEIACVISTLTLGDSIRIGERKQQTNLIMTVLPVRTSRSWKLSLPQIGGASDSLAGDTVDGGAGRVIVLSMQDIQTESQIGVAPAGGASQNISLAEQCGQLAGKIAEL